MKGVEPKVIYIEAPIAAGKTTFIDKFVPYLNEKQNMKAVICEEPVDLWIKNGTLKKQYENPKEWSFPAQCHFFDTRVDTFRNVYKENVGNCDVIVCERSLFTDRIFWETKYKTEEIDKDLYPIYLNLWSKWQELLPIQKPTLIVYFKVSVDECMKRLKNRGRQEEDSVTREYQKHLIDSHDMFLTEQVKLPNGDTIDCMYVDASVDFKNDEKQFKKIANDIINKI